MIMEARFIDKKMILKHFRNHTFHLVKQADTFELSPHTSKAWWLVMVGQVRFGHLWLV